MPQKTTVLIAANQSAACHGQSDYPEFPCRDTFWQAAPASQHDEAEDSSAANEIEDAYGCLVKAIERGKIRYLGISNETPWGAMLYQQLATKNSWPSIVSVQNPYSLLNRTYEIGLAEVSHRENMGLLAYSPLGFGMLSGKYINAKPADARITLYERFTRYSNEQALKATEAYVNLASQLDYTPAQMALAFVNTRPFVTANIIGATTMKQLKENIASIDVVLSEEVMEKIENIHQQIPNPSP